MFNRIMYFLSANLTSELVGYVQYPSCFDPALRDYMTRLAEFVCVGFRDLIHRCTVFTSDRVKKLPRFHKVCCSSGEDIVDSAIMDNCQKTGKWLAIHSRDVKPLIPNAL
jgi:hypothetical protein